jgi:hypothetical protein
MSLYQFSSDLSNETLSAKEKHASFNSFKTYFDQLCDDILKKTVFDDDQLAQHIFRQKWPDKQEELVFKKHLYAAKSTLARYDKLVNEANFLQFNYVIRMLAFDLFQLVKYGEKKYRNTDLNFDMGTRPDQNAREIFDVAHAVLHFGTIDPETAYLREVIPISIFLLRQTIEVFGKRALGFHSITDKDGNRSRNVSTQVAWDFIKFEVSKPNSRIKLQANVETIKKAEEWTNRYVHTGFIPEIFLIENAIHFVERLIYPMNEVADYRKMVRFYGTTQISEYNSVKSDFEKFINPTRRQSWLVRIWRQILVLLRLRKKPKKMIVNWMNVDRIDATILSL